MTQASWPPRIVAASAGLLWMDSDLLILRPTYKPDWTLPGGVIEEGESPLSAAVREVAEETNLRRTAGTLKAIDYETPSESGGRRRYGGLRFIFDLGELTEREISTIRLPEGEIAEFRIVSVENAYELLDDALSRRLRGIVTAASDPSIATAVVYMEVGHPRA